MFTTENLNDLIDDYLKHCDYHPTRKGLAESLNTSPSTIYRALSGFYNHKPYGIVPHNNRIIDTKDFVIIRGLFPKSFK